MVTASRKAAVAICYTKVFIVLIGYLSSRYTVLYRIEGELLVKFTKDKEDDGLIIFIHTELLSQELSRVHGKNDAQLTVANVQKLDQQHRLLFVGDEQHDFLTTWGIPTPTVLPVDHATDTIGMVKSYVQEYNLPIAQSCYMASDHTVSFFRTPRNSDPKTVLPDTITLNFHNFDDMLSWICEHPLPYQYLEHALIAGAHMIREGYLVAFPTETVYGLGADATNPEAVQHIFTAKKRPLYDPLIVHVSYREQMIPLITELPKKAEQLMDRFWPGPLTIVLPRSSLIPPVVTAHTNSVAIRMPQNLLARELIRLSGKPIAAPSANLFGCTSPTTARHVQEQLAGSYEMIIDGGACVVGIESTVISFLEETPRILRPGGIHQQEIEDCIGPVFSSKDNEGIDTSASPGLLASHYATTTPLRIVEDISAYASQRDVGILLFGSSDINFLGPVEHLSPSANPAEAAKRLYHAMRRLDKLNLSLLVTSLLPEEGIGIAVNNRLRKAAYKA
jgi:L-threonylcarbamoyladenylate synthase